MKKLLLVCVTVFCAVSAFALQDGAGKLEIAYEAMGYIYREPHMEYPISDKASLKQGLSAKYTHLGLLSSLGAKDDTFFSVEARYTQGDVDYRGYTMSGVPAKGDNLTDWYAEGRLLVGKVYNFGECLTLSPYLGVGYRYLINHAEEEPGGYKRKSTYFYVPIGAEAEWYMGAGWSVAITGEFDWMIHGNQKSYMSGTGEHLDPPYEDFYSKDVRNQQRKGIGLRGGIKLEKDMGSFGVFVEPFYRFWKIQNSEWSPWMFSNGTDEMYAEYPPDSGLVQGLIEPFNITREYGVKVGVSF